MEKFVKILKKLFPFTIILILVYFIPPDFLFFCSRMMKPSGGC